MKWRLSLGVIAINSDVNRADAAKVTWIMTGNAMPAPSCDMDCHRAHITITPRLASPGLEINSISGKSLTIINIQY